METNSQKTTWMHCTVSPNSGNRCQLLFSQRILRYDLDGFLEISREQARDGPASITIQVLRLSGSLIEVADCGGPRKIWLYPSASRPHAFTGTSKRNGVEEVTGTISLAIESRDPAIDAPLEPVGDVFVASRFATVRLHATLSLGLDSPLLVLRADGAGESPLITSEIATQLVLCCGRSFFDSPQCLELCLHIKIASVLDKNGDYTPLVEAKEVIAVVEAANKILGCKPPGQCCIQLRIGAIVSVSVPQIPLDVDGSKAASVVAVTMLERTEPNSKCYNVYVVQSIAGTAGGVTAWGAAGKDGSLIDQASAMNPNNGGRILAHELGHALGLADDRDAGKFDDNGVDHHSNDPKNLMSGVNPGGPPGNELNELQCRKMRCSPHLVTIGPDCKDKPRGSILV